ncbi:MAG: hydroxymethylbilane synthase [Chitinophagaceae bacterium]|jgi:hydroxymethylbilane synthase|nr:hydroxymethylbilane synthase [Chitinophagaceae bacterium]
MNKVLRIGTRDSQLAVWQATWVQELLQQKGISAELVYIKSEGDIDLTTPLYELGVQGIFTKTLDAALLAARIDIAVHSMKDVPTQMAKGLMQAAVLERASTQDILVYKDPAVPETLGYRNKQWSFGNEADPLATTAYTIATSSVRRKAQWLNRYPRHQVDNLRGNVNTRLRKLTEEPWQGAIFAAAGLERINLRPELSINLDWMLPAPAQGAIVVVCRESDTQTYEACATLNHADTALCTAIERDFLRALMGGCATPISGIATVADDIVDFKGNVLSLDGKQKITVSMSRKRSLASDMGKDAAAELLAQGAKAIIGNIRHAGE